MSWWMMAAVVARSCAEGTRGWSGAATVARIIADASRRQVKGSDGNSADGRIFGSIMPRRYERGPSISPARPPLGEAGVLAHCRRRNNLAGVGRRSDTCAGANCFT